MREQIQYKMIKILKTNHLLILMSIYKSIGVYSLFDLKCKYKQLYL